MSANKLCQSLTEKWNVTNGIHFLRCVETTDSSRVNKIEEKNVNRVIRWENVAHSRQDEVGTLLNTTCCAVGWDSMGAKCSRHAFGHVFVVVVCSQRHRAIRKWSLNMISMPAPSHKSHSMIFNFVAIGSWSWCSRDDEPSDASHRIVFELVSILTLSMAPNRRTNRIIIESKSILWNSKQKTLRGVWRSSHGCNYE